MAAGKNTFNSNSPEWQIWENFQSCDSLIRSHTDDVTRLTEKIAQIRERRELFKAALDKLAPGWDGQ